MAKVGPMVMEVNFNSNQIMDLINSFNSKIEKLESNLAIKDDQISNLKHRISEIEFFLHI